MVQLGPTTTVEQVKNMPRPRFIKSHLPIAFLPKALWTVKPKMVYVIRDAKDTAVSWYHHNVNIHHYLGTYDEFLTLFLKGEVIYSSYWDHIEQFFMLQKSYKNMKIIKFEDMKTDLSRALKQLCLFLNKFLSDEQLETLTEHLRFDNMKKNKSVNGEQLQPLVEANNPGSEYTFLRRGEIGSFKDEMPAKFVFKFNEVTRDRFKGLELYQ